MAWWPPLRHLLPLAVLLPGILLPAWAGTPVQVVTSELPPLAMSASPAGRGALHDMVLELGRRTGIDFNISFVPWRRAVFLSTSRSRVAIFPLTRSPDREQQYRWLAPLHRETFLFLSMKDGKFNSDNPAASKQRRIGVLRGSLMVPYLKANGYPNLVEASSVAEGLRFLQRGIVDAIVGDRDIFTTSLKDQQPERYAMSAPLRETSTWLGGSRDFSEADAALLQQAMKEMMEDGTCARILRKYHIPQ